MIPNIEEILEAIQPIATQMMEINSNCMKVTMKDDDDKPVLTIIVARENKAVLADAMMDLVDQAYDAGESAKRDPVEDNDDNIIFDDEDDD